MSASAADAAKAGGRAEPSLMFSVGGEPQRIELRRLEGVVAWAELRPGEERGVLGWLDLHGEAVPVIDLNQLLYGEPTERWLGSRILLLRCHLSGGRSRIVGAIASEVFAIARDDARESLERFDPCDVLSSILQGLP